MLEELGSGSFEDVATGELTNRTPIADRNHVLLFAEGYRQEDLPIFDADVADWVGYVFSIEPYSLFPDAFVVWSIPRPSNTTIRATPMDTAWAVPVDATGGFAFTGSISSTGETATRAWGAVDVFAYPPTDLSGGGFGTVRKLTAAFLIFDPDYGHASVSGRATSLEDPGNGSARLSSAFGVGHAHEFTHAFAAVRDEYLENDNGVPNYSPTANVTPSSSCGELPWAHLLAGGPYNETDELVGAFGRSFNGYHSELVCLMNGFHDNAEYYGGDGLLRVDDRMCNFCREISTYRIYSRGGLIEDYDSWQATYRDPFYERFGFNVPSPVPQTNDVDNPASGTPIYEACDGAHAPPPEPAITARVPLPPEHRCQGTPVG